MKANKIPLWVILFWIALWQIASMIIDSKLLLPSPILVITSLCSLLQMSLVWQSIFFTISRLILGFLLAISCGILFACMAHRCFYIKQLLSPIMLVAKSVPVASFTILLLMLVSPSNLSIAISFIMILPIVYTNLAIAMEQLDPNLNEMATIFQLSLRSKIQYIYIPQMLAPFRSACSIGLGMCFKAGIAAEVIGLPDNSIGEQLYQSKIYLNMPDLFAWTILIILCSFLLEHLVSFAIYLISKQLEKVRLHD